jgi:uncharacterized protein YjbI with pentapeptide repeats
MTLHDIWVMFYNAGVTLYDILFWPIAVGLVASILWLLFSVWPGRVFPPSRSSKREEIVADLKARNIVRLIIAIALAGVGFVATFIQSTINFNRDLRQRTDATISENYAKAIALLGSSGLERWRTIGSLHLLAKIADQDPTYHRPVFRTVAEYLVSPDRTECKSELDKQSTYAIAPELNIAAQIFGDRNLDHEPAFERLYNLDGVCLSKAALLKAKGFRGAWMPGARLFRVDLREADLRKADLRGAMAGVIYMDTWKSMKQDYGDNPIRELIKRKDPYRLSRLWADFSGADLSSASLDGALFEGANFENATFSGAFMRGTILEMASLKNADFSDAVLTGAHFNQADLTGTKFDGAQMAGAEFDGAHVTLTDFRNAQGLDPAKMAKTCVDAENAVQVVKNQPKGLRGISIPECPK